MLTSHYAPMRSVTLWCCVTLQFSRSSFSSETAYLCSFWTGSWTWNK